jgi:hypothetical protein
MFGNYERKQSQDVYQLKALKNQLKMQPRNLAQQPINLTNLNNPKA